MTSSNPGEKKQSALLAVWLTLILFLRWPVFFTGADPNKDVAAYTQAGAILLRGGRPFLDYWDFKGPVLHLANAFGLALGFGQLWGVWLLSAALTVLAFHVVGREMRLRFGARGAWLGGIVGVAALSGVIDAGGLLEQYVLPLQAVGLVLVARWGEARRPAAHGALLGASAAAAFFVKANLMGFAVAAALAITCTSIVQRSWRSYLLWASGALAGAAAVSVLVFAYLGANGAMAAFIAQFFGYSFLYIETSVADRLMALLAGMRLAGTLAAVLPIAGVLASVLILRSDVRAPKAALHVFAAVWLPIEAALACLSGREYAHYFLMVALPMMVAATIFAAHTLSAAPAHRRLDPLPLLAVAIAGPSLALLAASVVRQGEFRVRPQHAATAAYVREHSEPGDAVYVWGASPQLYHMSDRRPASRFLYAFPLVTPGYADASLVQDLLSDLERSRPVLIVDASSEVGMPALIRPAAGAGVLAPWLQYVRDHYALADSVGQFAVLRRKDPP